MFLKPANTNEQFSFLYVITLIIRLSTGFIFSIKKCGKFEGTGLIIEVLSVPKPSLQINALLF